MWAYLGVFGFIWAILGHSFLGVLFLSRHTTWSPYLSVFLGLSHLCLSLALGLNL